MHLIEIQFDYGLDQNKFDLFHFELNFIEIFFFFYRIQMKLILKKKNLFDVFLGVQRNKYFVNDLMRN